MIKTLGDVLRMVAAGELCLVVVGYLPIQMLSFAVVKWVYRPLLRCETTPIANGMGLVCVGDHMVWF